jgi:hypothetical protein
MLTGYDSICRHLNIKKYIYIILIFLSRPMFLAASELLLNPSNQLGHIMTTLTEVNLMPRLSKQLSREILKLTQQDQV